MQITIVLAKIDERQFLEIGIYNLGDDGSEPRKGSNKWGLWIKMLEKYRWLKVFSRTRGISCEQWVIDKLEEIEKREEIIVSPWQDWPLT